MFDIDKNDDVDMYLAEVERETMLRLIKYAEAKGFPDDAYFDEVLGELLREVEWRDSE